MSTSTTLSRWTGRTLPISLPCRTPTTAPPRFHLLREFDPNPGDTQVPDPYFGDADGFDRVYDMVFRSCSALLTYLEKKRTGTIDRA